MMPTGIFLDSLVFLAITVFAQRHQRMFVADGRIDGHCLARQCSSKTVSVKTIMYEKQHLGKWRDDDVYNMPMRFIYQKLCGIMGGIITWNELVQCS